VIGHRVRATVLLGAVAALPAGSARGEPVPDPVGHGTVVRHAVAAAGQRGRYLEYVPPGLPQRGRVPAVVVLHGGTQPAESLLQRGQPAIRWQTLADRHRFVVVYPQTVPVWNDCRADNPFAGHGDDVGFIAAVVRRLVRQRGVDPRRVNVAGESNGAMMALRLAIEDGRRYAAFGLGAGQLAARSKCHGQPPPATVVYLKGDADRVIPFDGGVVGPGSRGTVRSAKATIAFWRRANHLPAEAASSRAVPDRDRFDGSRVTERRFTARRRRSLTVELVHGGGHGPPSVLYPFGAIPLLGPQNRDLETADVEWRAFRGARRDTSGQPRSTHVMSRQKIAGGEGTANARTDSPRRSRTP
jgi:polyhydroxybutyrate depolymerase